MVRAVALGVAVALLVGATTASAQQFNGGIPSGWSCLGSCGASGADGVVTLAPGGGTQYGWVSTSGGQLGVNLPGVGGEEGEGAGEATNGSRLRSPVFTVGSGDVLSFKFNYITSDGAGYADYAWARLLDGSGNPLATIFTARTTTEGSTVPGFEMPPLPPGVTLNPSTVSIVGGAPAWSPLGSYSGLCYGPGCGYTGWITSSYTIGASGNYILEFGVTNWDDQIFHSGLAFDGLALNGVVIPPGVPTVVPEPSTLLLVGTGLAGAARLRRRRRA